MPGISHAEVNRRFASSWTLLSAGDERALDDKTPTRYYLFQRGTGSL